MLQCDKEKEITELLTKMKEIYPVIMGNGKDGLKTSVAKIADRLQDLKDQNIEDKQIRQDLTTSVNALLIFQTEILTEKQVRDELLKDRKISRRWFIALVISNAIALAGIFIAINF